jgi:hypothetical protein
MVQCNVDCNRVSEELSVTKTDCERMEEEIDQLLNDPETPMYPTGFGFWLKRLPKGAVRASSSASYHSKSLASFARSTVPSTSPAAAVALGISEPQSSASRDAKSGASIGAVISFTRSALNRERITSRAATTGS